MGTPLAWSHWVYGTADMARSRIELAGNVTDDIAHAVDIVLIRFQGNGVEAAIRYRFHGQRQPGLRPTVCQSDNPDGQHGWQKSQKQNDGNGHTQTDDRETLQMSQQN